MTAGSKRRDTGGRERVAATGLSSAAVPATDGEISTWAPIKRLHLPRLLRGAAWESGRSRTELCPPPILLTCLPASCSICLPPSVPLGIIHPPPAAGQGLTKCARGWWGRAGVKECGAGSWSSSGLELSAVLDFPLSNLLSPLASPSILFAMPWGARTCSAPWSVPSFFLYLSLCWKSCCFEVIFGGRRKKKKKKEPRLCHSLYQPGEKKKSHIF